MATSAESRPRAEKPAPKTIPLRHGTIRVALTVSNAPAWAWTLPVTGEHAEPNNVPTGKKVMSGIADVCFGTAFFATHRLASVRRKDVSFDGKRRDKFIFVLVPADEFKEDGRDPAFQAAAFAAFSEYFCKQAFNKGSVYDNGEYGMLVELSGPANRENANNDFGPA